MGWAACLCMVSCTTSQRSRFKPAASTANEAVHPSGISKLVAAIVAYVQWGTVEEDCRS